MVAFGLRPRRHAVRLRSSARGMRFPVADEHGAAGSRAGHAIGLSAHRSTSIGGCMRVHVGARDGTAVALVLLALAASASASPSLVGGGGFDYYQGPGGEFTRSALGIVGASAAGGSATLAVMRYADNLTGDGMGYVGSVGAPVSPTTTLRGWASRFVGDDSLRAWRVKAGPLVQIPSGGTVGVYYTHAEDNLGGRSDGGSAELSLPFASRFTGRAAAAFATAPGGLHAGQGSDGLGFTPTHGLELTGEVGLARNGTLTTSPGPSRGPLLEGPGEGGGSG